MRKPRRKKSELPIVVKVETRKDFFERGKKIARLLDEGKMVLPRRIISFEDPQDLIKFLSESKFALIAVIRKKPDSISGLAHKLQRSRAAVDKDVQLLESVGIVKSEYVVNPGHGKCRLIKAIDSKPIKLQVEAVL